MSEAARTAMSAFIVRAPVMRALDDEQAVRAATARDAAAIKARAEAEADYYRQATGQAAAAEAARFLAAAQVAAEASLSAHEAELTELAFAIAHRLVADLPRNDRTISLVRTALAEHRDWLRLTVRASPPVAAALRLALGGGGKVDVQDDTSLGPDECVLIRPQGRTELGPLQQFRALMAASSAKEQA